MPSNELKATIPASLNECNVCPITTSYLFDPVSLKHNDESEICMENNMFERSVIERHMENKSTCPMCRKEIIEIVPLDSNYVDELEKIYDKENAWDQVYFDFKGFIECAQKGNLNNELGKKYLKILLASPEEITRKQDIVEDFETPLAVIAQFGDLSTFKEFFNKSQAKIDYNFINELQNFVKPEISNFLFEVIKDIASIEEILGVDSVSINREFLLSSLKGLISNDEFKKRLFKLVVEKLQKSDQELCTSVLNSTYIMQDIINNKFCNVDYMDILIENRIEINKTSNVPVRYGSNESPKYNPFNLLVKHNKIDLVKKLIEGNIVDIVQVDFQSIINIVRKNETYDFLTDFLYKSEIKKLDQEFDLQIYMDVLSYSIKNNLTSDSCNLLEIQIPSELKESTELKSFYSENLKFAVKQNDIVLAKKMLEKGANPNKAFAETKYKTSYLGFKNKTHVYYTNLRVAVKQKNIEMIKLLLSFNADPFQDPGYEYNLDDRQTAFKIAVSINDYEILKTIINNNKKYKANDISDIYLKFTVVNNLSNSFNALLESIDKVNNIVLSEAFKQDDLNFTFIKRLIEKDLGILIENEDLYSFLYKAHTQKRNDIYEYLKQTIISKKQGSQSQEKLFFAVLERKSDEVKKLINREDFDINFSYFLGNKIYSKRAFSIAQDNQDYDTCSALLDGAVELCGGYKDADFLSRIVMKNHEELALKLAKKLRCLGEPLRDIEASYKNKNFKIFEALCDRLFSLIRIESKELFLNSELFQKIASEGPSEFTTYLISKGSDVNSLNNTRSPRPK